MAVSRQILRGKIDNPSFDNHMATWSFSKWGALGLLPSAAVPDFWSLE